MSVGHAAASSWRQGFFRPAAALASIWTTQEKGGSANVAQGAPTSEVDDSEEESIDQNTSNELLFSAQESIIDHDYADAVKKLEKSARYGNSAACAYLANVLTHGLDCGDEDHEEERVDVNPTAAARWAIRGLEIESGKATEGRRRPSTDDAPFASDIRAPEDMSTPSATPSEAGPFDFQAAADCASTLTLLFRTRRVKVKGDAAANEKGKHVDLAESAGRISRIVLQHDAVTSAVVGSYSQEKQRKIVNVNLLYLLALLDAEKEDTQEAESEWRKVVVIGEEGPIGDNSTDELVGNARRRLILLQNQRRDSETESPTLLASEKKRPSFERRSSAPTRRSTSGNRSPSGRKATFQLGSEDATSPVEEKESMNLLAPPSPRSARSLRRSMRAPKSPEKERPAPPARLLSFRTLSCIFQTYKPTAAPATVAMEAGSAILPPQEKLRSRTSVVSMVHDALPMSRSMLFPTLRRDMSAASLPDLASSVTSPVSPVSTSSIRFKGVRQWIAESASDEPSPVDAADALREALRRHDAFLSVMEGELTDVEEEEADDQNAVRKAVSDMGSPAAKTKAQKYRIKGLDPALAKLEDASRVNVMSVCAVCDAKGVNFPRCPKCAQTYCSRACRIGGGGDGERHVCRDSAPSTETVTPAPEAVTA